MWWGVGSGVRRHSLEVNQKYIRIGRRSWFHNGSDPGDDYLYVLRKSHVCFMRLAAQDC